MVNIDLIADVVKRYSGKVDSIAGQLKANHGSNIDRHELVEYGWFGLFHAIKDIGCNGQGFDRVVTRRIKKAITSRLKSRVGTNSLIDLAVFRARYCTTTYVLTQYPGYPRVVDEFGIKEEAFFFVAGLIEVCGLSEIQVRILAAGGYKTLDVPIAGVNDDTRAALVTAIQKLNPQHKLILGLFYELGLNFKEIGQVLDMKPGTVHRVHDAAVQGLGDCLRVGV